MTDTVADYLIAARKLIERPEDWAHEHDKRKWEGGTCLCAYDAVAIAVVESDTSWRIGRRHRVLSALASALPVAFQNNNKDGLHEIAVFNGLPTTTHNDILALFDRAINAELSPPQDSTK